MKMLEERKRKTQVPGRLFSYASPPAARRVPKYMNEEEDFGLPQTESKKKGNQKRPACK
jgi:hypothetical protein